MTEIQARLCMKYGFPVKAIIFDSSIKSEVKGYIVDINEFIDKEFKTFTYSVTIATNSKEQYTTRLANVNILPEFIDTLDKYEKNMQQARLKACVMYLLAAGENKTKIINKVSSLVDELRADKKKGKRNKE